jgi:hypothetical protein
MASRTYRKVLTGSALLLRQHLPMDIPDHRFRISYRHVGTDCQFGLKGGS